MKEKLKLLVGPPIILMVVLITATMNFFDYEIPTALWWLNGILIVGSFGWYVVTNGMTTYVLKRTGEAVVVLFIIASAIFLLLRTLPGGPFDEEKALPPEVKANIEAKYNLDAPLHEQYVDYIVGLVQGNLGESYKYLGRSVTDILAETLPNTFKLGFFALLLAFTIGIPAGVYSASKHNKLSDNLTMFFAISGVALPSFFVAAIAIVVFCHGLGWLPVALWDGPEYYLLPVIILGVRPAAGIARLTRTSVLDVIQSDYIRTAKSKGLSNGMILYKHVLKNSLIPVLTYSGPLVAGILSGSFIIEIIFAVPGMGKHLIQSVNNRDYPLILGTALVFSVMLVVANLIVDLLYSYFDPRIKLS